MVNSKKTKILASILFILVLLGGYILSNTNINSSSPINFTKKDNFNFIEKVTELNINENQKDLELINIGKDGNKVYMKFDNSGKMIYIIKNLDTNEDFPLYESNDVFSTSFSNVYNDDLYIVETYIKNDKLISYIVMVDKQKNIYRYEIEKMNKIPYIQQADNLLLINYEYKEDNKVNSYLSYFNMDTKELSNIDKKYYEINPSGTVTGSYILFCGGMGDSIYYQIVEYNNEDIEKGGRAYIYKISNKSKSKKIKTLDEKLIFISGDDNSIVTSDYIFEAPFYNSGKLYLKNDNEWFEIIIPKITAGADIIGVEKIDDKVLLIYNNEFYYLYDYDNQKYTIKSYKKEEAMSSKIKTFESGFLFLEKINNKFFLNIYTYLN